MMFFLTASPKKKVAYFLLHKVATTSIRRAFVESEEARDEIDKEMQGIANDPKFYLDGTLIRASLIRDFEHITQGSKHNPLPLVDLLGVKGIHLENKRWLISGYDKGVGFHRKLISAQEINSYFIFTFVRNPFSRLVSCFQDKFSYSDDGKSLIATESMQSADNFPSQVSSFEDFARQVSAIPGEVANGHFRPQHVPLDFFATLGGQISFIGHYERLSEEFEEIRQKYKLLPLEKTNTSTRKARHKNWRDYYTPEIAKIVYEYYIQDFKQFGYELEYPKLITYLKKTLPSRSLRWRKRYLLAKLGNKRYQKQFASPIANPQEK